MDLSWFQQLPTRGSVSSLSSKDQSRSARIVRTGDNADKVEVEEGLGVEPLLQNVIFIIDIVKEHAMLH